MTGPSDAVELPGELASARAAREFVRKAALAGSAADALVDDAVLLCSEIVTNAVLHAAGPVTVRVGAGPTHVRVEVDDASPQAPTRRQYGWDADTGRGLALLDGAAARWGVEPSPTGKTVWFVVGEMPEAEPAVPHPSPDGATGTAPAEDAVEVRILDLPVKVYVAAQQHNDALLREFALIARSDHAGASVPTRLTALVDEVRSRFGAESSASREQITRALEAGVERVDMTLAVPPGVAPFARRLTELLDEADEYCRAGELLTLQAPPLVLRFRHWYLDQVLVQLEGGAPSAWADPA